jgi:hypothetical protein
MFFITTFLSQVQAQTVIPPGDVSGTWMLTGSPYQVQGDIQIPDGSTLTIEPGVTVEFQGHYALNVQGRLLAIGTVTDSIIFTVNDTTGFSQPDTILGGWNGIQFIDTPLSNDSSKIKYCKLKYGKAVGTGLPDNNGGAIYIANFNKLEIANCLIISNSAGGSNSPAGGGLALYSSNIKLENNIISYNRAWDGGAVIIYECDPVFINNQIISNHAEAGGGGVWIGGVANTNPKFNGDIFLNNVSGTIGGGMVCWQTTNTTLNSVTLIGNSSDAGGGIAVIDCEMQVNDCNINDNSATSFGGGLSASFSNLYINGTSFSSDSSTFQSGAINSWYSSLDIANCQFTDNYSAVNYGAIGADSSTVNISNSIFTSNSSIWGGALGVSTGELHMNNCVVENNSAEHGGGLISGWNELGLSNVSFEQNISIWGGGMSVTNCNLEIDNCSFFQNQASDDGGGIQYVVDTTEFTIPYIVQIKNSDFIENSAFYRGALGIQQYNSETSMVNIEISECNFVDNSTDRGGNLLINGYIDDFLIAGSTFRGNTASLRTSGCNFSNHVNGKVVNCLFISNQSSGGSSAGGSSASAVGTGSNVSFTNCTFSKNLGSAALTLRNNGNSMLLNNIFWNNHPSTVILNAVNDSTPCTIDINYNDIQFGMDSVIVNDTVSLVNWGIGNINLDPIFVDTSSSDYHLQDGSPCIGAGIDSLEIMGTWYLAPITDLEGNPRPNPAGSMPDMGAYESPQGSPVGIEDNLSEQIPNKYFISQNYPNPFNPITHIRFALPIISDVKIELYNILGQRVSTLINARMPAGYHILDFDGGHFASGIYICRIEASNSSTNSKQIFVDIKKIVLMK